MTSEAIQKIFLASPFFAVVGASKDQTKFGTKVLNWYKQRSLAVTPVHPKEAELEGLATLKSLSELPSPKETSISIITPPKASSLAHDRGSRLLTPDPWIFQITLSLLEQAKDLSVPALWLQPGAEDAAVIDYIKNNNLSDRVIYGGPCILVEGDGIRSQL